MSDERTWMRGERDAAPPTVQQIAHLDAFLDSLVAERRPAPCVLTAVELAERMVAVQLRLARDGIENPAPEFLHALEQAMARGEARKTRRRGRISRSGFVGAALRTAAAAGLVGAGAELNALRGQTHEPQALVADAGRWYDVAAVDELSEGQMRPFAAGGVVGYLVVDGGRLYAISSICTHMGCRLKPAQSGGGLFCLCHGSEFRKDGTVVSGMALESLPRIDIRVEGGRVYAHGTTEDV